MNTSTINPLRFIPSYLTETLIFEDYNIEVYYNTEAKVAMGFSGKSKKSNFYNRFSKLENMESYIKTFIEREKKFLDEKNQEKQMKKSINSDLKASDHYAVGDILVNSWGYEQTNVEFYVVTVVKGKTIEIAELYQKEINYVSHGMACDVLPQNEIMPNGNSYKLRVKAGYKGSITLSQPESYFYIHKWEGTPKYKSWYN